MQKWSKWSNAFFVSIVLIYFGTGFTTLIGAFGEPWKEILGKPFFAPECTSFTYLFGTDLIGRSVLFKLLSGISVSFSVATVSTVITLTLGTLAGTCSGYFGRWVDFFVESGMIVIGSIPEMILLIAMTWVLGRGLFAAEVALGFYGSLGISRIVRGEIIKLKGGTLIEATKALGVPLGIQFKTLFLPSIYPILIVRGAAFFGEAIKAEVILSFLGLGVQGQPSWGTMLGDARSELTQGIWWQFAFTGIFLFGIVFSVNQCGEILRKRFEMEFAHENDG